MQQAPAPSSRVYFTVLIASTFLMGSNTVCSKVLLPIFPPMVQAGCRFLFAALLTLPIVLLYEKGIAVRTPSTHPLKGARMWMLVFVIGMLQTAAPMGLLNLSLLYIPAPIASILLFSSPIWVALLNRIFFKEYLSKASIVGLILGIVGVICAIGPTQGGMLVGTLLGLASALCWASATIFVKHSAPPLRSWTLSFWQMLFGALVLLAISWGLGEQLPSHISFQDGLWFMWLVGATTGAFGLWYVALGISGATKASSFLFLAPLFTTIISHLMMGNELTLIQYLGGVLIGFSLWLINQKTSSGSASRRFLATKNRKLTNRFT